MISAPSSPNGIDSETASRPETILRLTCDEGHGDSVTPGASSVFSSIKQTAAALAGAAGGQAVRRAIDAARGADNMREAVVNTERLDAAIQRANADQARRSARCTRATLDALVCHTLQPCIALDDSDRIVRWNAAMADWTGISEESALNSPLTAVFETATVEAIGAAGAALRDSEEEPGGVGADPVFVLEGPFALASGGAVGRVSLFPLCRIPHVIEEIVVLITPGLTD